MRFLTLLFVVISLAGCRTIMDPTFMPAGYKYHDNEYKSPPGPGVEDIDENSHWPKADLDIVYEYETNE